MADDVLAKIKEAKGYVDQAYESLIANFEKGENELECLEAVEGTATDLNVEAWVLKIELWVAMKRIPNWPMCEPSFLGKRRIPPFG